MAIVLFSSKNDCCGCGGCMNICPKQAITMQQDEYGFVYSKINESLCIDCGACKEVCGYHDLSQLKSVKQVYAAARKDKDQLKKSASGGVFAQIAHNIIKNDGVVYGAALQIDEHELSLSHIRIDKFDHLPLLLGSKYVQSNLGNTYSQVKMDLANGLKVLYSGTPCQIAGLLKFIKKPYDNLLTIDIICHGVPSAKMFGDFIKQYEGDLGGNITEFYFRDKSKGQGMMTRAVYRSPEGSQKKKVKNGGLLSYMYLFLKSYTYRSNCYTCPFAKTERVGDITLGDFWGFHEEYPEYKKKNGLSNGKGISCVLINSEKGLQAFNDIREKLEVLQSTFDKVDSHNEQLHAPSHRSEFRDKLMELYKIEGYKGVESYYQKHCVKGRMMYMLSDLLPKGIRRMIKRIAGKLKRK